MNAPTHHCLTCGHDLDGTEDLVVDLGQDVVLVDGVSVELTPSQARVLGALASQMPRFVSRETLMMELYPMADGGAENDHIIPVFISKIRHKLQETTLIIDRRYGLGYRLLRTTAAAA